MNAKIFRGKRIDNEKWIYGKLRRCFPPPEFKAICTINDELVESKTVGCFTGKYDENRNEIFSDDVIQYRIDNEIVLGTIIDNDDCFIIKTKGSNGFDISWGQEMKIIGNIHDKPELLCQ